MIMMCDQYIYTQYNLQYHGKMPPEFFFIKKDKNACTKYSKFSHSDQWYESEQTRYHLSVVHKDNTF